MDLGALEQTLSKDGGRTHWADCYLHHKDCAIARLCRLVRAADKAREAYIPGKHYDPKALEAAAIAYDKERDAGGDDAPLPRPEPNPPDYDPKSS